jgi:hypothetical protein
VSRGQDMRERVVINALSSRELGNAEKVALIGLTMLPTEYVDGKRRPGSTGMTSRGRFSLHHDYIARGLGTTVVNVKKLLQRLESKGHLSKVYPGTYGRPSGWQALDVRGDTMSPLKGGFRFVPPYAVETTPTRGDTMSPLTYRTPDLGDPAPSSRVSRPADPQVLGSNEEAAVRPAGASSADCQWHDEASPCPEDCANHPASRRRTA